jgi:hypothetical protein
MTRGCEQSLEMAQHERIVFDDADFQFDTPPRWS